MHAQPRRNETMTTDIETGLTIHRELGPIVTFSPNSPAGREWLVSNGADEQGVYIIEAEHAPLTIQCAEFDGLTVERDPYLSKWAGSGSR
jgi:hypothetical protein